MLGPRPATTATSKPPGAAFTPHYQGSGRGLWERVCGGGPLGTEHEGELALRREVALGRAEGRTGSVELQSAEVVFLEEAVIAAQLTYGRQLLSRSGGAARSSSMLNNSPPYRTCPLRKSRTFRSPAL